MPYWNRNTSRNGQIPYGATKRMPDGGVGVHVGGGVYIARPNYKWSIKDRGYVRVIGKRDEPDSPDIDIDKPRQTPENPGIRKVSVSTYGINIPVSIGRRAIAGNVIDSTDLVPRLVGGYDYYTTTRVYKKIDVGPS